MALDRPYDRPNFQSTAAGQYPLLPVKWGTPVVGTSAGAITYAYTLYGAGSPTTITSADHHRVIAEAFDEWAAVADITFSRAPDGTDADIELWFETIDQSGTLGYATFEQYPADEQTLTQLDDAIVVFNTYEFGTAGRINSSELAKFKTVALHEIGHAIGLEHTEREDDLMYPFYDQTKSITQNDAAAAEFLYGAPTGQPGLLLLGDNTANSLFAHSGGQILYGEGGNDTLLGNSSDDTLIGGTGNDSLSANAGDDVLVDAFGNDTLKGGPGIDNLLALEGNNRLAGGTDNDVLRGGIGDDCLQGGAGDDALWGDFQTSWNSNNFLFFGNDTLVGGGGDDSLFGGYGRDTFVFAPADGIDDIAPIKYLSGFTADPDAFRVGSDLFANNYRADFEPGTDKIDVTAFGFASPTDVLAALSDAPGHVQFQAAGTTIRIWNISRDDLSIDDFIWI